LLLYVLQCFQITTPTTTKAGDDIVQPPAPAGAGGAPTNNNNTADSNDGPRENAQATPTTARDENSQWSNDTWRDIPLATL